MSSRHKAAGTADVLSAARDKCTDRHARLGLSKVWDAAGKVIASRLKAGKVGHPHARLPCRTITSLTLQRHRGGVARADP